MTDADDHLAAIRTARGHYVEARTALFDAIRAALAADVGPSAIARAAEFSREYIAKIRDGKGPKGV
ncbi:hypothetical protein [Nocardia jinanensis]|uniref:Uncharacterized protein n=1 Tax=Nocardia jinanensis TaxID=382504 RepID=A0A917RXF9_9NOCA|nr:hypothetical protein [Nocardia jinanensis]GGL44025.1 hypothetical protein GCM10011588_68470 [Nocardia jinanensis]